MAMSFFSRAAGAACISRLGRACGGAAPPAANPLGARRLAHPLVVVRQPHGAERALRAAGGVHLDHHGVGEEHVLLGHVRRDDLLHVAVRPLRHERTLGAELAVVGFVIVHGVELEEAVLVAVDDALDRALDVVHIEVEGAVARLLAQEALLEGSNDADVDAEHRRGQGPLVLRALLPHATLLAIPLGDLERVHAVLRNQLPRGGEHVAVGEGLVVDARLRRGGRAAARGSDGHRRRRSRPEGEVGVRLPARDRVGAGVGVKG
eukprot:scaffold64476_cov51-Phaeocystis_antarctica.AAC.4